MSIEDCPTRKSYVHFELFQIKGLKHYRRHFYADISGQTRGGRGFVKFN